MKKTILLLCLIIFFSTNSQSDVLAEHPSESNDWKLTFEDNFNDSTLDLSKWFPGYRLGRVAYYKRIGFPNDHTRGWQPCPPLAHYALEDGILKLRVDKDLPKRDTPTTKTVSCITSAIYEYNEGTKNFDDKVHFSQKYGWFEIRCRLTRGTGAYTAFWLHTVGAHNQEYAVDGSKKGISDGVLEIDIFEMLGRCVDQKINYFNIHYTKNGHHSYKMDFDPTINYHTWAINWKEGKITWYCDGKSIWTYTGPTPQKEMYLLAAMFQIGGWSGDIDPQMKYPLDFDIDYIKVWKKVL